VYPASEIKLLSYQIYVDANNYCEMAIVLGADSTTLKLKCSVYTDGNLEDFYEEGWSYGTATMRILHYQSKVYFIANGSLKKVSRRFIGVNAYRRIFASNETSAYRIWNITVEQFEARTFTVFGPSIDYDTTTVSDYRVRGLVPSSIDERDQEAAYKGYVDVQVVTAQTVIPSTSGTDDYEYYYLDSFRMFDSQQEGEKLSLISDPQVKTPVGKTGLGDGY